MQNLFTFDQNDEEPHPHQQDIKNNVDDCPLFQFTNTPVCIGRPEFQ